MMTRMGVSRLRVLYMGILSVRRPHSAKPVFRVYSADMGASWRNLRHEKGGQLNPPAACNGCRIASVKNICG